VIFVSGARAKKH
ncbi:phage minor tail protein L, partial [Escherichia coli EC1847]